MVGQRLTKGAGKLLSCGFHYLPTHVTELALSRPTSWPLPPGIVFSTQVEAVGGLGGSVGEVSFCMGLEYERETSISYTRRH